MEAMPILDERIARGLLHSEDLNPLDEENFHPWRLLASSPSNPFGDYSPQTTFTRPFLRRWDVVSGSHPDEGGRMQARDPRQRLHTSAIRRDVLTWHANHRDWIHDTPFISFASTLSRLTGFMETRNWTGRSTLTVVNPNVRIAKRLPMINMGSEMRHYQVADPYGRGYAYYDEQYLLLWEVTAEEIVRHWDWDELSREPDWYERVVVPAFREHNERFLEEEEERMMGGLDVFDLSSMQGALPGQDAHGDDDEDEDDHGHDHGHDDDDDDGHDADRSASVCEIGHSDDSESPSASASDTGFSA